MDKISIIVPCYNEEETLDLFYQELKKNENNIIPKVAWEYIFIDDGSSDKTLSKLRQLAIIDHRIHYLSFSKNFGKEAGILAGLQHATGNYIGLMDADLQDPPEMLIEMYTILTTEPFDCVGTRRVDRKGEPRIRSWFARKFYQIINQISDTQIIDGARDYRLMTRQMVNAILEVTEYNRFSKGIFSWVGFETKYLTYENRNRIAGKTSWDFFSLVKYSVEGIISFSQFPLDLAAIIGVIVFALSIILALFLIIRTLIFGNPTSGWTSLIVIILGIGGLQLLCLGIVGKYVGKTFIETKKRPHYIIKERDHNSQNEI